MQGHGHYYAVYSYNAQDWDIDQVNAYYEQYVQDRADPTKEHAKKAKTVHADLKR